MEPWVLTLISIIGTAIAMLVVEVLTRIIYDILRRPILKIGEDNPLRLPRRGGNQPLITHHSITIRNEGKTAARNCIGTVFIDAQPGDLIHPFITNLPVILSPGLSGKRAFGGQVCWSEINNPSRITINANDQALLDIYRVVCKGGHTHIEIPSERGWNILRMALSANKEYTGKLIITAENAQRVERRFKLKPISQHDVLIEFE
ncbi:MAG: hypothetical protein DRJ38_06400 [Thermoprotei archaeon]|nr:MAG: hypothetical protein DRJ38_06400 [Thermoprotei archaeon]